MDFRRFFHKNSSGIARDRLKVVLLSDRMNCSPEKIRLIKRDIVRVLGKYLEIDDTLSVEIRLDITRQIEQGVKNVKTIQIKGL